MKKILIVDDSQSWINYHFDAIRKIFGNQIEIDTAKSASEANDKIYENTNNPYDIILTDMQMENDYAPLYAGEWLIEQIKNIKSYYKTKIIIISATNSIKLIAEKYNADYIPKYYCKEISNYKEKLS